jgi:transcriptional regulator with XRE-family HTH domain
MRRPRNYDKQFGYIVVPLFLEQRRGESMERALKRSGFEGVATVIAAMQEQDEDLVDIIKTIRREDGEGVEGEGRERLKEKIDVIGSTLDLGTLRKAVQAKLVERLGESWDYMYGLLISWRKNHHDEVPQVEEVFRGKKIGVWVHTQRANYSSGALSDDRLSKLESLAGWYWNHDGWLWSRGVQSVKEFAAANKHLDVPEDFVSKYDIRLNSWMRTVRYRRKRNELSREKINELAGIAEWSWNPEDDRWISTYEEVKALTKNESVQELEKDRKRYGAWILGNKVRHPTHPNLKKFKRKPLKEWQIKRLESLPGWSWNRRTGSWLNYFNALVAYKKKHDGRLPPLNKENKTLEFNGLRIVGWMIKQRSRMEIRKPWQLKMMREMLPELLASPFEKRWNEAFDKLKDYVKATKATYIPQETIWRGFALGVWISKQRIKYRNKKLTQEQMRRLQSIKGWTWDASALSASGLSKQGVSPLKRARKLR